VYSNAAIWRGAWGGKTKKTLTEKEGGKKGKVKEWALPNPGNNYYTTSRCRQTDFLFQKT